MASIQGRTFAENQQIELSRRSAAAWKTLQQRVELLCPDLADSVMDNIESLGDFKDLISVVETPQLLDAMIKSAVQEIDQRGVPGGVISNHVQHMAEDNRISVLREKYTFLARKNDMSDHLPTESSSQLSLQNHQKSKNFKMSSLNKRNGGKIQQNYVLSVEDVILMDPSRQKDGISSIVTSKVQLKFPKISYHEVVEKTMTLDVATLLILLGSQEVLDCFLGCIKQELDLTSSKFSAEVVLRRVLQDMLKARVDENYASHEEQIVQRFMRMDVRGIVAIIDSPKTMDLLVQQMHPHLDADSVHCLSSLSSEGIFLAYL